MDLKRILIYAFIIISVQFFYGQVDMRIQVAEKINVSVADPDTLIIDVEAVSQDQKTHAISGFQGALKINPALQAEDIEVIFQDYLFPETRYTVTEDYRASMGRIRYVYTHNTGEIGQIGTDWTCVVRIVLILPANQAMTFDWFDQLPKYMVTDDQNEAITGKKHPVHID